MDFSQNEITPIDVAATQIGIYEETGHNDGVPADRYMRGDPLAWCAGFVLWCVDESDWPSLYLSAREYYRMRNVANLRDMMIKRGVFFGHGLKHLVWPNDLIFYAKRGQSDGASGWHVGIVEGLRVDDRGMLRAFSTIEGNWGDAVRRRRVSVNEPSIYGFARIAALSNG